MKMKLMFVLFSTIGVVGMAFGASISDLSYYTNDNNRVIITSCDQSASGGLVIPSSINGLPVTGLRNQSFWGCTGLVSITIGESVTSIGDYTFRWCDSLESISLPNNLQVLGEGAFSKCSSLLSIDLSSGSFSTIPKSLLDGCSSLNSVTIGSNVTAIDGWAFQGCESLVSIDIPDSVVSIGRNAFEDCIGLVEISLPDGMSSVGVEVFRQCTSMTNVAFGTGVASIGFDAFAGCSSLETLFIPDNVVSIDESFLECSSLKCVTFGRGLTSIGSIAFELCSSLEHITFLGSVAPSMGEDVFYDISPNATIVYPLGGTGYGTTFGGIPTIGLDWVVADGGVTITDCDPDISGAVKLPEIIECKPVVNIGDSAFKDCTVMTGVEIPSAVTNIGNQAFENCSELAYIEVPDNVQRIGDQAFKDCTSLEGIILGSNVNSIGAEAFYNCTSLISATLGDSSSVADIGASAFYGCSALVNLWIGSSVTNIDSQAFAACSNLYCVTFLGDPPPAIAEDTFEGVYYYIVTYPTGANSYTNISVFDDVPTYEANPEIDYCNVFAIAEVKRILIGQAYVVRGGASIHLNEGDPLFKNDVIKTNPKSAVRIVFTDQSSMTIGPKSMLKVERVSKNKATVVNFLTGKIRSQVNKYKPGEKHKLWVRKRVAAIGVRGTEFEAEYYEADGIATSTCSVVTGLVDYIELETGMITQLGAGQSNSIMGAVSTPTLTINSPGNGGGTVFVDGSPVSSFPYTMSGFQGQEVSVQAVTNSGWDFQGWTGVVEGTNASQIAFINGDSAATASFTLDSLAASNQFNTAVVNAGLTGPDAMPLAVPFTDGLPNLIKYASNMDLSAFDDQRLDGGTTGLPVSQVGANSAFQLKYLRSKSGGVIYAPKVSTDLEEWDSFVVPETVTNIDADWEVVTLEQPPSIDSAAYYKVDVSLP